MQKKEKQKTQITLLVEEFFAIKGVVGVIPPLVFRRYVKPASEIIELSDGDLAKSIHALKRMSLWANDRKLDWNLDTVVKRWMEVGIAAKPISSVQACKKCGSTGSLVYDNGDYLCFPCLK